MSRNTNRADDLLRRHKDGECDDKYPEKRNKPPILQVPTRTNKFHADRDEFTFYDPKSSRLRQSENFRDCISNNLCKMSLGSRATPLPQLYSFQKEDGPPPDPAYNFLADPERDSVQPEHVRRLPASDKDRARRGRLGDAGDGYCDDQFTEKWNKPPISQVPTQTINFHADQDEFSFFDPKSPRLRQSKNFQDYISNNLCKIILGSRGKPLPKWYSFKKEDGPPPDPFYNFLADPERDPSQPERVRRPPARDRDRACRGRCGDAGDDGPPPDPVYNFLADPERDPVQPERVRRPPPRDRDRASRDAGRSQQQLRRFWENQEYKAKKLAALRHRLRMATGGRPPIQEHLDVDKTVKVVSGLDNFNRISTWNNNPNTTNVIRPVSPAEEDDDFECFEIDQVARPRPAADDLMSAPSQPASVPVLPSAFVVSKECIAVQTAVSPPANLSNAGNHLPHTIEPAVCKKARVQDVLHKDRLHISEMQVETMEYLRQALQMELLTIKLKAEQEQRSIRNQAGLHDLDVEEKREAIKARRCHREALEAQELKHRDALSLLEREEQQSKMQYQASVRALKLQMLHRHQQ